MHDVLAVFRVNTTMMDVAGMYFPVPSVARRFVVIAIPVSALVTVQVLTENSIYYWKTI